MPRVAENPFAVFARLAAPLAVAVVLVGSVHAAQIRYELRESGFQTIEAPEPGTPAAELQEIRRLIADGHGDAAWSRADRWIDRHPGHPLMPEALLLRGDAKVVEGDYYKALFDYEQLVRRYPGSAQFHVALEREFEIARLFAGGTNRKLLGLRLIPAEGEAEELLIRIQERAPGSPLAEQAGKHLADYYYGDGQMYLASEAYDLFVENYPNSPWARAAMQRQIEANLATFKGPRYDPTGLFEARSRIDRFEQSYPGAAEEADVPALRIRIDESLAEKKMVAARWYEGQGQSVSAAFMYERVIERHPRSTAAQQALRRLRALAPDRAEQLAGQLAEDRADPSETADSPAPEPADSPASE